MIPIKTMVDIKLTVDDIMHINGLIERDEALAVKADTSDPEKWGRCPKCDLFVARYDEDNHFCKRCGQRIDIDNTAF